MDATDTVPFSFDGHEQKAALLDETTDAKSHLKNRHEPFAAKGDAVVQCLRRLYGLRTIDASTV